MSDIFKPVIGLEIHIQPKTNSKMFCGCSADYFGKAPNTHTCPVCLGLPGALPVPNKKAIEQCMKLALSTNCEINAFSKFDRKNYFYPDLPKGYQISQDDKPIGYDGYIEIDIDGDSKRIRIARVHMEEDTGKSMHQGDDTLLDFNKSGMPLVEMVTYPEFEDSMEVTLFAKRLRQIVRYLDISDADMEKGQMRFELNISLRKVEEQKLPDYKVEVKNISSISVLEKVINFEVERQTQILQKGEKVLQETRGLKDLSGKTYSRRTKGNSDDYRYFPEPDIPPMYFSREMIDTIKNSITELPHEKKTRYMSEYSMPPASAETIIASKSKSIWFESGLPDGKIDKKVVLEYTNMFISDVLGMLKAQKAKLSSLKFESAMLYDLAKRVATSQIARSAAKRQVLPAMYDTGLQLDEIIKSKGLDEIIDESRLMDIVNDVIAKNPKIVESIYKNPNAIKALLGQVMGITKGKADPIKVDELIRARLVL